MSTTVTKREKHQIEAALKVAYDNAIKEQDVHCDRATRMESIGNRDYLKTLPTMGWTGIAKEMAEECWPASHEERKVFLDQSWEEIPSQIQIDKIDDQDIRASTFFLGEVVEHCHRIKSQAKFNEVLGSHPRDPFANQLYRIWTMHSFFTQFTEEQLASGNNEVGNSMLQLAKATEGIFDLFAKDPEMSDKLDLNKEKSEIL